MKRFLIYLTGLLLIPAFLNAEPVHKGSVPAKPDADRWGFYLQPVVPAEVFINRDKVEIQSRVVDKSLGYISLKRPQKAFILTVKTKEGSLRTGVDLSREEDLLIQKIGEKYYRVGYFDSGVKPKSVTFLNDSVVSVPLLDAEGISIIDLKNSTRRMLSLPKQYIKKPGFVETAVLNDLQEFWVSQMSSRVHVFDLKTLQYKKTIPVSGRWTKFMVYDAPRKRVYVSNWLSGSIVVIDANEKKEISRRRLKAIPRGLLLSSDKKSLYATIYSDINDDPTKGRVISMNLESGDITDLPGKRGAKRHIVRDHRGRIYVSDMLNAIVEVIDESTLKVIKTINVDPKPNSIAVSPDDHYLYVSCRGPNNRTSYLLKGPRFGKIIIIDLNKLETVLEIEGGNQPTGLDVSPDGKFLVTSDFLDHRLRVYRLKDGLPCLEED